MLSTNDIPLSESALLVVDAQDSFKVDPKWERRNNRNFERNVSALIDAYRAAGRPVIFFLHTDSDPGFERDSVHLRLMDFITVREGEPVILKDTRNTFTGTTLQAQLLALGVRRLAITGIQMEQCCETTARVASDLGYRTVFVTDATSTNPIEHRDAPPGRELAEILADPRTLGTREIIERTEYALSGRFATVTGVDALVREWQDRASGRE
jgi:nicotinamidase-related amidase